MTSITKSVAMKNSVWKVMESFLSKGISMVVSIVLARLISPKGYGLIALTAVFTQLSDILIQAGFSTTLIRKEKVTDEDYSTVLGISIIISSILYLIFFFSAPLISDFYNTPLLTSVLRIMALSLFFQAFSAVRTAVVSREMRFKVLMICSLISNIVSGTAGVLLAYLKFGVWALVGQQLIQQFFLTATLFVAVKMKLRFRIFKKNAKELLPFSTLVLTSSLISYVGSSLYSIVIGKVYSMQELGYYDKGSLFPMTISLYIFSAVSNVFLPVFSSIQQDDKKLNSIFQRVLSVSCYIIFPLMGGLCVTATPLISVILTDTWLPSVPIMRWNCLYYAMTPLLLAHVNLHFAIGKGSTRIKVELERIVLMVIALIIMVSVGVSTSTVACVMALIQVLVVIFITLESVKVIKFSIFTTMKNVLPTVICTVGMMFTGFLISKISIPYSVMLLLQVFCGVLVYVVLSILLKNSAYKETIGLVNALRQK
jgi:teichuronic acid exporter